MKKLSILLFAVITALIFHSCSKNDEETKTILEATIDKVRGSRGKALQLTSMIVEKFK